MEGQMTRVYRLEWADRVGMYHWEQASEKDWNAISKSLPRNPVDFEPMPQHDDELMSSYQEIEGYYPHSRLDFEPFCCAFVDIPQIFKWFPKNLMQKLIHHNLFVRVYEVTKCIKGETQCLIPLEEQEESSPVEEYTLEQFLKLHPEP